MDDLERTLAGIRLAPYIVKGMALIGVRRRGGSNMFRHQISTTVDGVREPKAEYLQRISKTCSMTAGARHSGRASRRTVSTARPVARVAAGR